MNPTTNVPLVGPKRKIMCCGFSDEVEEYGEVIPGVALGHDPKDGSWFLSRDHDKDLTFPIRPYRDPWEEYDVAQATGADKATLDAIQARLESDMPEELFTQREADVETVSVKTIADFQDLLHIYEVAKTVDYNFDGGTFTVWLFHRAGRLLATGSV